MRKTSSFKSNVAKLPVAASWNYKHLIDLLWSNNDVSHKPCHSTTWHQAKHQHHWVDPTMMRDSNGHPPSRGKRCPVESASFQQHSLLLTACGWCVWISTEQIMAINIAPHQKGIGLSKQNPLKQHIQSNGFKPMKQLVAKFCDFHIFCFLHQKNETTIALNWHLPNSFRIPMLLQWSWAAVLFGYPSDPVFSTVKTCKNLGWKHYSLEFFTW